MTLLSDDSARISKGENIVISHKKEISCGIELKRKKKKKRTHGHGQHCSDCGEEEGGWK